MPGPRVSQLNKLLHLVAIVFCTFVIAQSQQTTCTLKLDQLPDAPELQGFHLGMTAEEAKAKVPQIMFGRADQFGVVKTSINPSFDRQFDQAAFAGVRTISLVFLDGKLVILWIGYDSTFKWQTLDEVVAGISRSLNLSSAWMSKQGGRHLMCGRLSVFVSMIAGSPSIRLSDEGAQEIVATRREEAAAAAEVATLVVIGDKRTKLFYTSHCEALEAVAEPNRVIFKDKDEAEKAGYKLAKDCQ